MFRGVCSSVTSKSAVRHNSSAAFAHEWLKPLNSSKSRPTEAFQASSSRPSSYATSGEPSTSKAGRAFRALDDFAEEFGRDDGPSVPRGLKTGHEALLKSTSERRDRFQPRRVTETTPDETPRLADRKSRHHQLSGLSRMLGDSDSGRLDDFPPPYRHSSRNEFFEHQPRRHPALRPARRDHSGPLMEALKDAPARRHRGRFREMPIIRPQDAVPYFQANVYDWAGRGMTFRRLVSFGIPEKQARILLNRFVREVQAGKLSSHTVAYGLDRFGQEHTSENSIDIIYSTIFFSWASRLHEFPGVERKLLAHIQRLTEAASNPFPENGWTEARRMRRRIIMHVGPTNSGKTHHALRALAAAPSGVYAGPLRLLAHEIFTRLNSGSIVPLGVEQDPAAPAGPNPAHARLCNMVTGEEHRIASPDATLLSCTVEMLNPDEDVDVAVVDEIQMIGDPDRGSAWTKALIGLAAKEIHLCGEETAVPLVKALLAQTGDEIEVRKYERLTPLRVDENVLDGDFSKIEKGDGIVTFSRSSIFALKKEVEKATGMRCAVVYGRLPPETRSEQATLFNDPNSGYDVIIGSDAIGMGLNLKIKRVIFAATSKFNGKEDVPLAVSSVKQIAGRAGRFGMHKDEAGGTATTVYKEDLPHLKHCIAQPYRPLPYAMYEVQRETISEILSLLPAPSTIRVALSATQYIGMLPSHLRYTDPDVSRAATEYVDTHWLDMPVADKIAMLFSPVPWRDVRTVDQCKLLFEAHRDQSSVRFFESMAKTDMMSELERAEKMVETGQVVLPDPTPAPAAPAVEATDNTADKDATAASNDTPPSAPVTAPAPAKLGPGRAEQRQIVAGLLMKLESYHKVIVVYMWWSFRHPIIYSEGQEVQLVKQRVEVALNGLLGILSRQISDTVKLKDMVHGKVKKNGSVGQSQEDEKVVEALQALE